MLDEPKIIKAKSNRDHIIDIELSDQRKLKLDMKPFLEYPCYKKLNNLAFFFAVKHNRNQIYWDDMHDMHIDQILQFSKENK